MDEVRSLAYTVDEDGGVTDSEGTYWQDGLESFIQGKVFGFCCCGNPELMIEYVLEAMELLEWHSNTEPHPSYEEYKKRLDIIFADRRTEILMWYWLDSKEWTEHGGGVPGWLTPEGYKVMALLRKWKSEQKEE